MYSTRISRVVFAIITCIASTSVHAGTYLGLPLGEADKDAVAKQLRQQQASFGDDYGWKGYVNELPIFKINAYHKFDKFGQVKEAWLGFAPDGKLYQIDVTWWDAGATFKMLKDALDSKYGNAAGKGFGFDSNYTYRDGPVSIVLERDTFGFSDEQKTRLRYTYTPLLSKVRSARALIEQDIKEKNARKAAGDL